MVDHVCHPSGSEGWWVPTSLGLQCAWPARFPHHIWHQSDDLGELRSAGCLRKGEPTQVRNRAAQFLAKSLPVSGSSVSGGPVYLGPCTKTVGNLNQ